MLPVPGGTVTETCAPTVWVPFAVVGSTQASGGVGWAATHPGSVCGPETPPCTGAGAVPVGLHTGGAFGARQRPPVQVSWVLAQGGGWAEQEAKQNEPVDVLTQLLPDGQVPWSAGLHAAVQAPPGNSGPLPQISPAAQVEPVQALPRSELAGRPCGGQLASGTQAPNPGQHEYPLRQSEDVVHDFEQRIPLPLARRSVQVAPLGHASPAQVNVQRPPGMAVAQTEPTEHAASVVHASPTVRTEAVLQVPVSHTRPGPHWVSAEHGAGL